MNVTLNIGTVSIPLTSADQVLGDWIFVVSVMNGDVGSLYKRIDSTTPTAELESPPPGSYSATAQRFDTGGNAFGSQVSATFSIPEPVVIPAEAVAALTTTQIAPVAMGEAAGTLTVTLS